MIRRIGQSTPARKASAARPKRKQDAAVTSRARRSWRILRRSLTLLAWCGLGWLVLSLLLILPLRWLAPPTTSYMLQQSRQLPVKIVYTWIPYEQISPQMVLAAVAAEDQKFPYHFGFDFVSIQQAWRDYQNGRALRGASTITQQLCKNLYLWSGRSLLRKGLEAWCTVWVEVLWPKQRILEVYLNIVELGTGVFGVEAASQGYFGIPAAQLKHEQAALLAAVFPNPKTYSVITPSRYLRNRQNWILRQMRQLGGVAYIANL